MNKKELSDALDEIEERIEIQILTLQIIREHLVDLLARIDRAKNDSV
jgi:regulator of replication initiation timing